MITLPWFFCTASFGSFGGFETRRGLIFSVSIPSSMSIFHSTRIQGVRSRPEFNWEDVKWRGQAGRPKVGRISNGFQLDVAIHLTSFDQIRWKMVETSSRFHDDDDHDDDD